MKNASSYCNYNEAFKCYDSVRKPVGIPETLELLKKMPIPSSDITLLEGGFGTGAYSLEVCSHVGTIYGIEGSEEGCRKAARKLCKHSNVFLMLGNILSLPFPEKVFDAYMVHQVVHHLNPANNFRELTIFLKEGFRILKKGGIIIINTCSPEQVDPKNGVFWSYSFMPEAANELKKRYIPVDDLKNRLLMTGFCNVGVEKATGRFFKDSYYEDPSSVMAEEFYAGDSVYCFLNDEKIKKFRKLILQAIKDGSVFREMERAKRRFEEIGEAIIVYGFKR